MAITPIQTNINNTKSQKPFREAEGTIKTKNNVKPLPPEGHLVHDRVLSMPKYFLKDIAYDMKAVRDGFKGNANDHQTGRLNDVGLKLGGVGIATMLAARTSNPMVRIMEYAGLGAFLFAMSAFPKVAIQAPSRAIHGFDTGIEYIDDQGRKKSMFQDGNYIPFDMYRGERRSEDLDVIGDRLGIPRDIKNRNDLTKEQMRKIAIQNNTLWMLTAGFATPVITALTCCGLEKVIAPVLEKARNANYNSKISHTLARTSKMTDEISSNKLSKQVEKVLAGYKNQELPKAEFDNLVSLLTKNMDANASEGIKADLANIFKSEKGFAVNDKSAEELVNAIKASLPNRNKSALEKVFVPTKEELAEILKKDDIASVKDGLKQLFAGKMDKEAGLSREYLTAYQNEVIENISKSLQKNPVRTVNENNIKEVVDFAKILGEFKENDKILDKCKSFKFEYAPETVLARSYGKFERTLLDVLGIKYKDLKQMKESEKFAQEMFEKKLAELVKDNTKYEKAVSKLTKVMAEMEKNLNGNSNDASHIKDLITAIENNYNNTAKRLSKSGKFQNTINRLVKEDVSTLSNSLNTKQDLFNLLDGTTAVKTNLNGLENVKYNAKGVGSSKNLEISRMVERYQGANNSFRRILHLFDVFKRPEAAGAYDKEIMAKGKDALLKATSSDHTMKLNTINNPEYYKDIMRTIWKDGIEETTEKAMKSANNMTDGNILERFNKYITRFRDIIGNNNIDFTKPQHKLDEGVLNKYTKSAKTRMAKFNLVAQNPVDMIKNAAERRYGNQKWLRIVSVIGGAVLGGTVLAQFAFGKISNPHNLQKQVSDDTNS